MKPQRIRGEHLTISQQKEVNAWLKSNGCPYMLPLESKIVVHGNHVHLETWTIKRAAQIKHLWPKAGIYAAPPRPIPSKQRTYRIRHALHITPATGDGK